MASKTNSIETNWARAPPPSGPAWRRIANVIYNPDEKSFLGRTAKRWGIMLIFYSVFYAVLALLFSACMGGLFLTIDPKTPSYTLEKSLIGNNPGVAYRPLPEFGLNIQYNLTGYDVYTEQLTEFLAPYQHAKLVTSEECTAQDGYGYPEAPCFFIKLNKIINWVPECYDDAANLPAEMPQELQDHIKALDASKTKQIWLSCWEEKTNTTSIEYPWGRGLPAARYPYVNSEGYLAPVLAVRLAPPVNTAVAIRCRFWAKNIVYNKSMKEPSGYTRIPLTITDSSAPSAAEVKA